MEDSLNKYLGERNLKYIKVENEKSLRKIYDLIINNIIYEPDNEMEMHYLGFYYHHLMVDYDKMKHYYLMSIDKNNVLSMYLLGRYYMLIKKKYVKAIKYYKMAIENNWTQAFDEIGKCYQVIKDFDKMKEYYLLGIEKDCSRCMYRLGYYYKSIEKNPELMTKYMHMAINKNSTDAIYSLALYYKNSGDNDKMIEILKKGIELNDEDCLFELAKYYDNLKDHRAVQYYIAAAEQDHEKSIDALIEYYNKNIDKDIYDEYFFKFITMDNDLVAEKLSPNFKLIKKLYTEKIDLMELHFSYTLEGKGFNEAKNDFIKLLNTKSL